LESQLKKSNFNLEKKGLLLINNKKTAVIFENFRELILFIKGTDEEGLFLLASQFT
jgi:hypothetical protein